MVSERLSRILRIGCVNSGLFDSLDINADVAAIHLVGDNNTGKTSIIQLLQFLYFPNIRDAHFKQPLSETLPFYFRREGSYILFDIRTLSGGRRTMGLYGEGTSDSRQYFVFDGPFSILEFLDEKRQTLPLSAVRERLFKKGYYQFDRVEHVEKALLGEHTDGHANIHLFDLTKQSFHLFQQLVKHLLQLDKIQSQDVLIGLSLGASTW